jgi:hypothetical protein
MTKSLHLGIDHECCFNMVPSSTKITCATRFTRVVLGPVVMPLVLFLHRCTQTELNNLLSSNFEL